MPGRVENPVVLRCIMLKINCPHCKKEIEVSEDKLGEVAFCDSCKTSFVAGSSPDRESEPSTSSDGKSREHLQSDAPEVEYDGAFYSLKTFRRLNRRFIAFSSFFLLEVICFIALYFHMVRNLNHPFGGGSSVNPMVAGDAFLVIFIPLFVSYLLLLRTLRVFDPSIGRLGLYLYWLVPFMTVVCGVLQAQGPVFALLVIPMFIADIGYLLYYFSKASRILKSARAVVHSGGNPFVRGLKRYSFVLFPLLVSLFAMIFFFGSKKYEAGLCRNCGIWTDRDSICFLGMNLCFSSEYKPTAFSKYLDPEHRCPHYGGKTYLSGKVTFMLELLGVKDHVRGGTYCHSMSAYFLRRDHLRDFLKKYSNISDDNSSLYRFLCEKDSTDYVRRLISDDLTSEEEEEFLRLFDPSWGRYIDSGLKTVEDIRDDISGRIDD